MKINFAIIFKCNEAIEDKIKEEMKKYPEKHFVLLTSVFHSFCLAFNITKDDNFSMESFDIARVIEPEQTSVIPDHLEVIAETEKKIDK